MRSTTLHLNDDLARAVEEQARRSGKTFSEMIEGTLREVFLEKKPANANAYQLRWVTVRGEASPGVDISDRNALFEAMEGHS